MNNHALTTAPARVEVHKTAFSPPNMQARAGQQLDIANVPWWAVALLDEAKLSGDERRVRRNVQSGRTAHMLGPLADRWWSAFASLVDRAQQLAARTPLEAWLNQAYNECDHADVLHGGGSVARAMRDAALSGVRAFAQVLELRDDDGVALVFEDFHVITVRAMRESVDPASILLPFQFGKSVLSSEIVPLMDWCEWHNCTQGRIYHAENHVSKWIGRLMQHVEYNDNLHRLFPWVAKPVKGDMCFGIWSTEGFSIRGRTIKDKSFEALTIAAGKTGLRYHRTGVDDVVVSKEANSVPIQERNYGYLTTGVFTTEQRTTRTSKYGTVFPGQFQVGTLFEMNDTNYQVHEYAEEHGWPTIRFDIYPQGERAAKEKGIVLWPRVLPYEKCRKLEIKLGISAFEKRCRNFVRTGGHVTFPMDQVKRAESDAWEWGVVPANTRAMIGFDPGSGKITRDSKNPACVVYGEQDLAITAGPRELGILQDVRDTDADEATEELDYWRDTLVHIVEAHRLRGYSFPQQVEFIANLATRLQLPIAVEENNIQSAYGEEIVRRFPWVRIICHTTHDNKRDPKQGVETFQPLFARERIVIHARNAPIEDLTNLRMEWVLYPGGARTNTDMVMAAWIAKFQTNLERENSRQRRLPSRTPLGLVGSQFAGRRRIRLVRSA